MDPTTPGAAQKLNDAFSRAFAAAGIQQVHEFLPGTRVNIDHMVENLDALTDEMIAVRGIADTILEKLEP